jgi:hypothetical protein
MAKLYPVWDLFDKQPLRIRYPDATERAVAGVTKIKKGIIWWSANYFISIGLSNMPGSGFADYRIDGKLYFDSHFDTWCIKEEGELYKFLPANREILSDWDEYKEYIPSLEELKLMAKAKDK